MSLTFILIWNTKEDILKNVSTVFVLQYMKKITFQKIYIFVFPIRKVIIQDFEFSFLSELSL